jgi:hypothetical protein
MTFAIQISRRYALEISGLHFIRSIFDGITFYELNISADFFKADHNPQFKILWIILNFKVVELEIHNINHVS